MVEHGQWMLNKDDGEDWRASEYFDTKQEAVDYGTALLEEYNAFDGGKMTAEVLHIINTNLEDGMNINPDDSEYENIFVFYVGQLVRVALPDKTDDLIEIIADEVYETVGDYAENYLTDVTTEHKKELADLIHNWAEKNSYLPEYFSINNVTEIDIRKSEFTKWVAE